MITHVGFVGFFVRDLEAATTYYRDRLGLPFDEAQSIPGQLAYFELPGGVALNLFQGDAAQTDGPRYELGLIVDDALETYQVWKERAVEFVDASPQDLPFGRTFRLRTPEGHCIRIIQLPKPTQ
jgi:catechol 2,3-dioxygenase-like lactoylglutathione lyase family enzyme